MLNNVLKIQSLYNRKFGITSEHIRVTRICLQEFLSRSIKEEIFLNFIFAFVS